MSKAAPEDTDTTSVPPPLADESSAPYLIVLAGTQVGELHKLARPRTVVGRGDTADLRISDGGMSREHAEILLDGARVTIRDLGSTNGTYCNGASVQAVEVADGDKIVLGSTTILKFSHGDGIEATYRRDLHRGAGHDTS